MVYLIEIGQKLQMSLINLLEKMKLNIVQNQVIERNLKIILTQKICWLSLVLLNHSIVI